MKKPGGLTCCILGAAAFAGWAQEPTLTARERPDAPRIGLSVAVVLDFWSLPPTVQTSDPEVYVRLGVWESTLRLAFYGGWGLDLALDARIAPRAGIYRPACGVGIRLRSTSSDSGLCALVSVVPIRFDLGPLLGSLFRRTVPEVLVSACEFRYGPILPRALAPQRDLYLFRAELTLLRLAVGFQEG